MSLKLFRLFAVNMECFGGNLTLHPILEMEATETCISHYQPEPKVIPLRAECTLVPKKF